MTKTRNIPAPKAKRATKKEVRRDREASRNQATADTSLPDPTPPRVLRKLVCRTDNQKLYLKNLREKQLIISEGPAGVGKTFIATVWACEELDGGRTKRIVFTRPAVEAGENLGFLPGELEEKFAPWFEPFRRILVERYGQSHLENLMKRGHIEVSPLAYIRGLTFEDSIVILDEAQNSTPTQMKMLLTRMGENTTTVVNGDSDQKDIPGPSGIFDIKQRFRDMDNVGYVDFTVEDIVRSGIVRDILRRYSRPDSANVLTLPVKQESTAA